MTFKQKLEKLPNEINNYNLNITKEDDGEFCVTYDSSYSYLNVSKHDKCIFCNLDLEIAITETIAWLSNNKFI